VSHFGINYVRELLHQPTHSLFILIFDSHLNICSCGCHTSYWTGEDRWDARHLNLQPQHQVGLTQKGTSLLKCNKSFSPKKPTHKSSSNAFFAAVDYPLSINAGTVAYLLTFLRCSVYHIYFYAIYLLNNCLKSLKICIR